MTECLVFCDRCKKQVQEAYRDGAMTSGFYDVGFHPQSPWKEYARPGERNVCDRCMWEDPKYIRTYGHVKVR